MKSPSSGKGLGRDKLLLSMEQVALLDTAAASLPVSRHRFILDTATPWAEADLSVIALGMPSFDTDLTGSAPEPKRTLPAIER